MEFQKTVNLPEITLNDKKSSKFVTKIKVYDQSEKNYSINKKIKIERPIVVLSIKWNSILMEFHKIINLLGINFDDRDLPRFVTKKWIEVHD